MFHSGTESQQHSRRFFFHEKVIFFYYDNDYRKESDIKFLMTFLNLLFNKHPNNYVGS